MYFEDKEIIEWEKLNPSENALKLNKNINLLECKVGFKQIVRKHMKIFAVSNLYAYFFFCSINISKEFAVLINTQTIIQKSEIFIKNGKIRKFR